MSATPAPSLRRVLVIALGGIALAAGIVWLQAFVAGVTAAGFIAPPDNSLTQAYTTALAHGQAHLERTPDPRLLALSNPYDPLQNSGLGPLDASFYQGRFYLYFGIVPWALLLVPWFKLTGSYLSEGASIWLCCSFGFCCYALAVWEIWRRWFTRVSIIGIVAAWLILAVSSGTWVLLAQPQMTQIPSAAAYAFCAFAWLALVRAETHPAHQRRWLALALFSTALIMGCRPNYLPVVALMTCWVGFKLWRDRAAQSWKSIFAVMLPLVIVGGLLAGWNYVRFGDPLEFGFKYQLIALNRAAGEGEMSWHHLPFNLHRYLIGGARWAEYFPFITGEAPGPWPLPPGHDATDQVYGMVWIAPVLLLAFVGAVRGSGKLRFICVLLLLCSATNLLLLGAFGGGAYRYPVDFMATLALASCIGWFLLNEVKSTSLRRLGLGLSGGLLAWSAIVGLFQLVSFYDLFAGNHPVAYERLSRPFNALVYLRQQFQHDGPRGLKLHLRFPTQRAGQVEPLVVLGTESQQDFLYVYYPALNQVQLGFESIGRGGPSSRHLSLDFSQPHTLELRYGSFRPPDDHPSWRDRKPADRDIARRELTVLIDDLPILDGWADFHPPRAMRFVGSSPHNAAFGPRFTGTIEHFEEPPLAPLSSSPRWDAARYGALRVTLTLQPAPTTTREPLLSLGHRQQGALIVLERLHGTQVRLGYFPTSGGETWSAPFAWPTGVSQILTVDTGALFPPTTSSLWPDAIGSAELSRLKHRLECHLGTQSVWSTEVASLDVSPTTVALARNDVLLAGIAPTLAAELGAQERNPWVGTISPAAPGVRSSESGPKTEDRTSIRR